MNISQHRILRGNIFFHPRATIAKDKLVMTMQVIKGSDYFGPMQYSFSNNKGESWSSPEFIPGMGWIPVSDEIQEGICDVVPDYHSPTGTILAIGHNVYFKNNRLYDSVGDFHTETGPELKRFPVYSVYDAQGKWSGQRTKLCFPEFKDYAIYSCNCAQKIIMPDGKILIPITFGNYCRDITSFLCDFDGKELSVLKRGNILKHSIGRGLLEPSMIKYQDKYYMTLRAEDEHGYLSISNDGLNWQAIKSWQWDDDTPLTMSTTQQHWLKFNNKLYLIYTRKAKENINVFRWRAPVFIAQVDTEKLCLIKDTEQIVFPMGDPAKPETIGLMGNFHPLKISNAEAIVTVGAWQLETNFYGKTLLARLLEK